MKRLLLILVFAGIFASASSLLAQDGKKYTDGETVRGSDDVVYIYESKSGLFIKKGKTEKRYDLNVATGEFYEETGYQPDKPIDGPKCLYDENIFLANGAKCTSPIEKFESLLEAGVLKGKKILVIEDDPALAKLWSLQLGSKTQADIEVAMNTEQAEAKINATKFDLIYTDLKLDGSEHSLIDLIRSKDKNVPVIAVSGNYYSNSNYLWNKGFSGYLLKGPANNRVLGGFAYTAIIYLDAKNRYYQDPVMTEAEATKIADIYKNAKTTSYDEQEFRKTAIELLSHQYGDEVKDFSTDRLASAWADRILGFISKSNSSVYFSEEKDPYIDIEEAELILAPNGLFAYLKNKIDSRPEGNDVREVSKFILFTINGRINADLSKTDYKDLTIPEEYKKGSVLGINYYNMDLIYTVLCTLMLNDLEQGVKNGKTISELAVEKPILYIQTSVTALIEKASSEKYIDKARDYISKAGQIMEEFPKIRTALTSKFLTAEKKISERPKKALVEEIKKKFNIAYMSDDDVIIYGFDYVTRDLNGKMIDDETTKMTFGTLANNLEDGLLYQAFVMTNADMKARKRVNSYLKTLRLLLLCNNKYIKLENTPETDIVGFFLQDSMWNFSSYFFGIESPALSDETIDPITTNDFSMSKIPLSETLIKKGMEKFKLINEGLTLKK